MEIWKITPWNFLSDGEDIDGSDLFSELMIPQGTNMELEAIQFLKSVQGTFPNSSESFQNLN